MQSQDNVFVHAHDPKNLNMHRGIKPQPPGPCVYAIGWVGFWGWVSLQSCSLKVEGEMCRGRKLNGWVDGRGEIWTLSVELQASRKQ